MWLSSQCLGRRQRSSGRRLPRSSCTADDAAQLLPLRDGEGRQRGDRACDRLVQALVISARRCGLGEGFEVFRAYLDAPTDFYCGQSP